MITRQAVGALPPLLKRWHRGSHSKGGVVRWRVREGRPPPLQQTQLLLPPLLLLLLPLLLRLPLQLLLLNLVRTSTKMTRGVPRVAVVAVEESGGVHGGVHGGVYYEWYGRIVSEGGSSVRRAPESGEGGHHHPGASVLRKLGWPPERRRRSRRLSREGLLQFPCGLARRLGELRVSGGGRGGRRKAHAGGQRARSSGSGGGPQDHAPPPAAVGAGIAKIVAGGIVGGVGTFPGVAPGVAGVARVDTNREGEGGGGSVEPVRRDDEAERTRGVVTSRGR